MTEDGTFSGSYVSVEASISGIIRGLIREGYHFQKGFKIADIDPRESELANALPSRIKRGALAAACWKRSVDM